MIVYMIIIKDMQKIFLYVLLLNFDDVYFGIIFCKFYVKFINNIYFDNIYLRNFDKFYFLIVNYGFDDLCLYNIIFYKIFFEV